MSRDVYPRITPLVIGSIAEIVHDGVMRRPDDYRYIRLLELIEELEQSLIVLQFEASVLITAQQQQGEKTHES